MRRARRAAWLVRIIRTAPEPSQVIRDLAYGTVSYLVALAALYVIPHDNGVVLGLGALCVVAVIAEIATAATRRRLPRLELRNRPFRYMWPAAISGFGFITLLQNVTSDYAFVAGLPLLIVGYTVSDWLWIRGTRNRRQAVSQ